MIEQSCFVVRNSGIENLIVIISSFDIVFHPLCEHILIRKIIKYTLSVSLIISLLILE